MDMLLIRRVAKEEPSPTRGVLYLDGKYWGDTIEPGKTNGKGPIPKGTYEVTINRSMKFKRDLPLVLDVPNFRGIRFHAGTKEEHTKGCICVGSRSDEEQLIEKMKYAYKSNGHEPFMLSIHDWDDPDVAHIVQQHERIFDKHRV